MNAELKIIQLDNVAPARIARVFVCLAFSVLVFLITPLQVRCDFDQYYLHGVGSVSQSAGGNSAGLLNDQLDYLNNPALIYRSVAPRFTLDMSDWSNDYYESQKYNNTILSFASGNKGYSIVLDEAGFLSRDMFIYSLSLPFMKNKKDSHFGVNIAAFRFSTSIQTNVVGNTLTSDDGTGFSLDVGYFKDIGKKYKLGFTVSNLLTNGAEYETVYGRRELDLPRVMNLSLSYPLSPDIELFASYKSYSVAETGPGTTSSGNFFYLGMEYSKMKNIPIRSGYANSSLYRDAGDQYLVGGGSYLSGSLQGSVFGQYKNNDYNTAITAISVSYKQGKDQPWKTMPEDEPEPLPEEKPLEEKKPETEKPLPVIEKKKPPKPKPVKDSSLEVDGSEIAPAANYEGEPAKKTKVAEFNIDPKVIIITSNIQPQLPDLHGHWAAGYLRNLAEDGFFPPGKISGFSPTQPVNRAEFYRLVFINQLMSLFSTPLAVTFNTPYPVSAEMWLLSPELDEPVLMVEGTYDRSGSKRLVLNRNLLHEKEVFAGKYKVRLKLSGEDMLPEELEDYITVLDTSIDFMPIVRLQENQRKDQVSALQSNMGMLGLNVDYLAGLVKNDPITRIEALRAMLKSADVELPSEYDKKQLPSDVHNLPEEDQAAIFLATRGMFSLDGRALMNGYGGGIFGPLDLVTDAQAVALMDRFRKLAPSDFTPPYNKPAAPEKPSADYSPPPETNTVPPRKIDLPETTIAQYDAPPPQSTPANTRYLVVAGSFIAQQNAFQVAQALQTHGYTPEIYVEQLGATSVFHVSLGRYESRTDATSAVSRTPTAGLFSLSIVPVVDARIASPEAVQNSVMQPVQIYQPNARKQQPAPNNSEGWMELRGESFVPWNLIRNLEDFEPRSPENQYITSE